MPRILSVVGNRPQFIKAAPLQLALRDAGLDEVVLHTGQHWDPEMSAVFFDELEIPEPAHRLDLRTADTETLAAAIEPVARAERPDVVLVYGDTNSTLAGARVATTLDLPVVHVEAGMRSGDLTMPEEHTRIEVDRVAALLLCPDTRSQEILQAEDVTGRIEVVGDVMADATRLFGPIAREREPAPHPPCTYVIATLHREANVSQPRLGCILSGLGRLTEPVVFPAHPRTAAAIDRERIQLASTIELIEPLGYLAFASAVSQARVVVTDSGGLQKEAYWYGVPCVTTRPSTEWVDTVELGANTLVDDDPDALVSAVASAQMPAHRPTLYGDGHASERIAALLAADSL